MRSISEIKQEIAEEFMANESVANVYRFEVGSSFEKVFSALSVESVLMYVFAVCAWSVERLMAEHKMEEYQGTQAEMVQGQSAGIHGRRSVAR